MRCTAAPTLQKRIRSTITRHEWEGPTAKPLTTPQEKVTPVAHAAEPHVLVPPALETLLSSAAHKRVHHGNPHSTLSTYP
jgi:hypothetical protein